MPDSEVANHCLQIKTCTGYSREGCPAKAAMARPIGIDESNLFSIAIVPVFAVTIPRSVLLILFFNYFTLHIVEYNSSSGNFVFYLNMKKAQDPTLDISKKRKCRED